MIDKKLHTVVDIGSNTVKCSVFMISEGKVKEIASATEKLGLIAGISDRILSERHIAALASTLARYKTFARDEAKKLGLCEGDAGFSAYATASLRGIDNFAQTDDAAFSACGCRITLLSPEQEARTAFAGFRSLNGSPKKGILCDMGGGSTELSEFDGKEIKRLTSMDFGCLSIYKRFCAGEFPTAAEEKAITDFVAGRVRSESFAGTGGALCIVGGTGNAVRALLKDFGISSEKKITPNELDALRARLSTRDEGDIHRIEELIPTRRETIIPGLCAYCAIAHTLEAEKVRLLKGGLREGIMVKLTETENE